MTTRGKSEWPRCTSALIDPRSGSIRVSGIICDHFAPHGGRGGTGEEADTMAVVESGTLRNRARELQGRLEALRGYL